jgi:hypothetical protein
MGRFSVTIAAALFLAGCSETGSVEIEVTDHADPLTTNAGDKLFELKLNKAVTTSDWPAAPYPAAAVSVRVNEPGQTGRVLAFAHQDTNGDQKWDEGETLLVSEHADPLPDFYNPTKVGVAHNVAVTVSEGGTNYQVWTGIWTPAN